MPENKVTVGDIEITSLSDGLLAFDLCNFFPDIPEINWEPFGRYGAVAPVPCEHHSDNSP